MADRGPVLLTVSGSIPHDLDLEVAAGRRPRADYRVIAQVTDADVVDVERATNEMRLVGRLLYRIGGAGPLLGWYAFRRRRDYEVVLSDGEQVGIPLALLTRLFGKRGLTHVMIVHILSVPMKARLVRAARLVSQIDRYITYCTAQSQFLHERLGVPGNRIVQSTFMVDSQFFDPDRVTAQRRRLICSAGLERRDYATLMKAVDGLDIEVVVAAASPWSKQRDSSASRSIPPNVEIRRLDLFELRQLYAESAFVVMSLYEVDFQAGITTILEAMAMELAVVCTRTRGQTDTLVDGRTGIYVPPADAVALRATIQRLMRDQTEAKRLGRNGRQWVVRHADIETYARFLGRVVADARQPTTLSTRG